MKTIPITVALKDLVLSPLNVRTHVEDATQVDQLATNIAANGLLQPIAVHKMKKGKKLAVIAGQRRFRALEMLASQEPNALNDTVDFGSIPAVLLEGTDQELIEASLSENYCRAAMRDYEIYAAFKQLGLEPEQLAQHFGLDEARARRILKLGNLAPKVFDAYRKGDIKTPEAMAFAATDDHKLQATVLKDYRQLPEYSRSAHTIRRMLGFDDSENQRMFKRVGAEAYKAAGGRMEEDLFSDAVKILDPELLATLASEQDEKHRAELEANLPEGAELIDARPSYYLQVYAEQNPSVEQTQRLDAIADEITALEQIEDMDEDEYEAKIDALHDERADILASVPATLPEGPLQAYISRGYNRLSVEYYRHPTEEEQARIAETNERLEKMYAESEQHVAAKKEEGLTQKAEAWMGVARQAMLMAEVQRDADYPGRYRADLYLYLQAEKEGVVSLLGGFEAFLGWTEEEKDVVAAKLVAKLARSSDLDIRHRRLVEIVGPNIDAHPHEVWTPTEEFFSLFKKAKLLEFAREMGLGEDQYVNSNMKLGDIKDRLFKLVTGQAEAPGLSKEDKAAALAWVPEWLRFAKPKEEDARASVPPEQGEGEVEYEPDPDGIQIVGRINEHQLEEEMEDA